MAKLSHIILSLVLSLGLLLPACAAPSPVAPEPATETEQKATVQRSQPDGERDEPDSYEIIEPGRGYWDGVETLLQEIVAGVSETRGLAAPEQFDFRVVTADWAKRKWGDEYVADNRRKLEIDERIFKALLVLPPEPSLAEMYAEWPESYLSAVLGEEVFFIQDNLGRLNTADMARLLAHEAVHLLQGVHFETPPRATFDGDKAWAALVEGDADFSRTMYLEEVAQEPIPEIEAFSENFPEAQAGRARPEALTDLLYFPYRYGEPFVSALYEAGGWSAVNEAYRNPPVTTAQVMQPEKYLGGEEPESIQAISLDGTSWEEMRVDRMGQYFIQVMLENWLPRTEASGAARGWNGDRLAYYERPDTWLIVWQVLLDSEPDAAELYDALVKMLEKANAAPTEEGLWSCRGNYFRIERGNSQEVRVFVSEQRHALDATAPWHRISRAVFVATGRAAPPISLPVKAAPAGLRE